MCVIVLSAHTQYSFSEGLYFLNSKQPGLPQLPPNVFVAAEATAWVKQNVDGIKTTFDAIKLMQVYDTCQPYAMRKSTFTQNTSFLEPHTAAATLLSFATSADTTNVCRIHS